MKLHDFDRGVTLRQRPRALASYTTSRCSGSAFRPLTSTSVRTRAGNVRTRSLNSGQRRVTENRYWMKRAGASGNTESGSLSTGSLFHGVALGFSKMHLELCEDQVSGAPDRWTPKRALSGALLNWWPAGSGDEEARTAPKPAKPTKYPGDAADLSTRRAAVG